jgi:glutamate/tyrosine decarboxylase-like PLP-dependent enzyme
MRFPVTFKGPRLSRFNCPINNIYAGLPELTSSIVSPALTVIEKETTRRLAGLFGFTSEHAGGLTLPGGSASNSTSMIIAKNSLFPDTKTAGNAGYRFVVFTSVHGHYSVEKAAILLGLGSDAVWNIPVDKEGKMVVPGMLGLKLKDSIC